MRTITPLWIGELFVDSFRNLWRHKLRSTLTLLGMVFGVASVITMLAIGEGAQKTVLEEISNLGLKNIIIDSAKPPETTKSDEGGEGMSVYHFGLTHRDADQIQAVLPDSQMARALGVNQRIYDGSQRVNAKAYGVSPDYFTFFRTRITLGRPLTVGDELEVHSVAVVTESVAKALQGTGGGPGKTIKIGKKHFRVVGVVHMPAMKDQGRVFIPYKTAKLVFGTTTIKFEPGRAEFTRIDLGQIVVRAGHENEIRSMAETVRRTLEKSHRAADYRLTVPLDILRSKQKTQQIFNLVLVTIAAISLVVGGIGIMNIMLAIVMERVREIGIRRAIGARPRDIFLQFLSESLTLTSIGGITGCLLGITVVPLASTWTGWPGIITPQAIFMALLVSGIVGLVFGTAPALRASKLNPVDSLRYE